MDHQLFPPVEAQEAGTALSLDEELLAELAGLSLVELQVLHSRICHQLDHEYLTNPDGPHPGTLGRHRDLVAQLESRDKSTHRVVL